MFCLITAIKLAVPPVTTATAVLAAVVADTRYVPKHARAVAVTGVAPLTSDGVLLSSALSAWL